MKKSDYVVMVASILLLGAALAYGAPVPVRTATPDERAEQRAFAMLRERAKFLDALFGLGSVPESCKLGLLDPSQPYTRANLFLKCPKRLTVEDR